MSTRLSILDTPIGAYNVLTADILFSFYEKNIKVLMKEIMHSLLALQFVQEHTS